eukprot:531123-Alexandrium_andersonii.AAC.1
MEGQPGAAFGRQSRRPCRRAASLPGWSGAGLPPARARLSMSAAAARGRAGRGHPRRWGRC